MGQERRDPVPAWGLADTEHNTEHSPPLLISLSLCHPLVLSPCPGTHVYINEKEEKKRSDGPTAPSSKTAERREKQEKRDSRPM